MDVVEMAHGIVEIANAAMMAALRVSAIGDIAKPRLRELAPQGDAAAATQLGNRSVYFSERGGFVACNVYDRYELSAGVPIPGPAVILEMDSTTLVHPEMMRTLTVTAM